MASKMSKNWNSYNAHLWFGVLRTSGPGTFSSAPCYYGITALHEGHVRYTQELAVRVTKNLKQKSEATSLCTRLTTLWVKRKSRCITNTVHLLHSYYGSPLALAKATLKPRKIMKNKVSQKLLPLSQSPSMLWRTLVKLNLSFYFLFFQFTWKLEWAANATFKHTVSFGSSRLAHKA